ncbi:MAG: hypothetical protein K9J79_07770 [Desulfobacteraceae bacterium]|nr:hypothetical protein [Desulfobacteraceae bacterium]
MKQRYIKSENRKWLIGYLLLHIALFALFIGHVNFSLVDIDQFLTRIKNPQGFVSLGVAIFIIVLEGVFSNSIKEFLIFWRFKNRLPGHRAFSRIAHKDPRIDMNKIELLFPEGLPITPKEQNAEWNNLYRKYQNELQVFHSHKAFLLTRDLATLTILLCPLVVFGHFLLASDSKMLFYHISLLLVLYVIISLSARNYGERFVANVLVEAMFKKA